jgi:hypothetical protein
MEGGAVGHNFEMGLPKDYPSQIWFLDLHLEIDNGGRLKTKIYNKHDYLALHEWQGIFSVLYQI